MKAGIFGVTKTDLELSKEHANYTPEFIIGGLIKKEGKNIIAAERGAGKTRILLYISYAIIFGLKNVFGYPINIHGDLLFINMEIPEKDFKAFFDPIRRYFENNLGLKAAHKVHITSFRDVDCKLNDLKLIVQEFKPLMVIIDSYKLYQAVVCREEKIRDINNSNFDSVFRLLNELVSEFQTTIVLINHTNKGTSKLESNADLMFGPGALPDFVDHVTLIRKTKFPNQRIIVPDKSRFCGEGVFTTNLIEIKSSDHSSAYPDQLYFELIETDVDETELVTSRRNKTIDPEVKTQIIEFVLNGGTYAEAAKQFLNDEKLRGTVSKFVKKHNEGKI